MEVVLYKIGFSYKKVSDADFYLLVFDSCVIILNIYIVNLSKK
jgi:hypothetical protein